MNYKINSLRKILQVGFLVIFFSLFFVQHANASASLGVSSATLGSNGKTITVNISGVSGSLSCASNSCTGFQVLSGTYDWVIASATASGSTVTLTTDAKIGSNAVVTINLSSGSNLRDTSSNTAIQTTGASVVNNSNAPQAIIAFNDSKIALTANLPFEDLGSGWLKTPDDFAEYAFSFTGTDCAVMVYGVTIKVSIDNGAFSTITQSQSNFMRVSVASGLPDTLHKVVIKSEHYLQAVEAGLVVGSNPSFSVNPDYQYGYRLRGSGALDHIKIDGALTYFDAGLSALRAMKYTDFSITFRGSPTEIRIYGLSNNDYFDVYQDGTMILSHVIFPNAYGTTTSSWGMQTVATGLDGAMHTYRITPSDYVYASGQDTVTQPPLLSYADFIKLYLTGGTLDTSYIPSYNNAVGAIGDSNTQGVALPPNYESSTYLSTIASSLGMDRINAGVSSMSLSANNIESFQSSMNTSAILRRPPQTLIIHGTVNDYLNNGPATPSAIQTAATALLNNLWNGVTSGSDTLPGLKTTTGTRKIVWLEEHPAEAEPYRTNYSNAIRAAIAGITPPANASPIIYVTSRDATWPNTTALHYTTTEQNQIANGLIPYVALSGVTVSGPSSGASGAQSTNFTVTLAGGATFSGAQTVTISDGGDGGTITPSVGSANTSSVTVTPTNGLSSFTFKYTPASIGTKTLTFTNGQGWGDPSASTYTASTVPNAPTIGTATVSGNNVIVTFTPPGSNGGSVITGYTVKTYVSGVSQGTSFDSNIGSTSTSHTMTGLLTNGTQYTFTVYATNANGNSSESSATSPAVSLATVPSAPTSVVAVAADQGAVVSFTPGSDGGSAITGYTVTTYISGVSQGTSFDSNIGSTSTSHTMTGLTNGTSYTFKVVATNGVGPSSSSTASNAVIPVHIILATGGLLSSVNNTNSPSNSISSNSTITSRPLPTNVLQTNNPTNNVVISNPTNPTNTTIPNTLEVFTTPVSIVKSISTDTQRNLYVGVKKGNDVKNLQIFLNTEGYTISKTGVGSKGKENNSFGSNTKSALIEFQKDHHLKPDGIFGKNTRKEIQRILNLKK